MRQQRCGKAATRSPPKDLQTSTSTVEYSHSPLFKIYMLIMLADNILYADSLPPSLSRPLCPVASLSGRRHHHWIHHHPPRFSKATLARFTRAKQFWDPENVLYPTVLFSSSLVERKNYRWLFCSNHAPWYRKQESTTATACTEEVDWKEESLAT